MPTSARMWLGFFGQFADGGIRAPEQSGLLQQPLASIPHQQPTPKMALRDRDGLKLKSGDYYCIVGPDHDWTLRLGRGWYGIQGYPFGTRLVLGPQSAMISAPFPLVSRLGLALFTAVGVFWCYRVFSCYRVSRNGNERVEAHA